MKKWFLSRLAKALFKYMEDDVQRLQGDSFRVILSNQLPDQDGNFGPDWEKVQSMGWEDGKLTRADVERIQASPHVAGNDALSFALMAVVVNAMESRHELNRNEIIQLVRKETGKIIKDENWLAGFVKRLNSLQVR